MGMVDRVKNICLSPNTEWPVIAAESATAGGLITGYALPLIGVSAIAGFIGSTMIGVSVFGSTYRTGFGAGLVGAAFSVIVGVVGLFILSFLINALAPTFGGQQDSTQAMKVAVYSYTPAWVAGMLGIIPFLGMLAILGGLYGLYLLYLGLPTLMKSPADKSMGYTVVVVVAAIIIQLVLGGIVAMAGIGAVGAGVLGGAALGSGSSSSEDVQFDKDSPLGKLQELGKAMEKSGKEMETAQNSGDSAAAAAAATNMLGTLFGGGKKVDPLELDQLKAFIPDSFAGLAKEGSGRAEKNGMGGMMISKAEANYGEGSLKKANLEITDAGAASGLMGLASWAAAGSVKEDEDGSEKTTKVGGRLVHERRSKSGTDEYSVMIADRFMVTAKSSDMDVDALRAAVSKLDLAKLESMKDVGVQKP
ncbi:MAG: Yip1 family protein [Vicinamibacterales bacterium]